MKPKPNRKFIVSFVTLILISIFLLPTFILPKTASAQSTPPTNQIPADMLIKKGEWQDADKNKDKCTKLGDKVKVYTQNDAVKYTTYFYEDTINRTITIPGVGSYSTGSSCVLAPYTVDSSGNTVVVRGVAQSLTVKNLENTARANLDSANSSGATNLAANFFTNRGSYDASKDNTFSASESISQSVGWILSFILKVITTVVSWLTAIAGGIFVACVGWITDVNTMPAVVDVGWTVVRDIANMFFILVLIVIALGTILRFEEYDYKHLLREVIIMALLVNFSKEIALVLMNFVNVITMMFVPQGDIMKIFVYNIGLYKDLGALPPSAGAGLADGLGQLVFALISLFVFVVLAVMFLIRLIGLYVLIVISPMAYVLNILPQTKNYAAEWWKHFIKYLIWAPVALFFIKLASIMTTEMGSISGPKSTAFGFFIVAGFMMAAVMVAKQAGMVGSEQVMNLAKKGLTTVGKGAIGFVGRAYTKKNTEAIKKAELAKQPVRAALYRAAAFLNPKVAKEAWEQRSHHLDEEVYGQAVGYSHDTLNRVMPTEWHKKHGGGLGLGRKTNFGEIEYNKVIAKKTKEFNEAPLTEEQRVKLYTDSTHLDDKIAILRSIVLNRHEDGLAAAWGVDYDSTDFKQAIFNDLEHAGASKEQIGQQMNFISEISEEGRKIRGMGSGVVDKDGVARASVDLTYLDTLAKSKNSGDDAVLVDQLKGLNVIDGDGRFIDSHGAVVKDSSGTEVVIRTGADYTNAINNTAGNDKTKRQNFEHEIKAARAAKETIKRLKRTDSEDVVKALEPAAVATQGLDGKYKHLHSEGARILERLNPSVGNAVPNMRRTQARFQALVGGSENEDGTINYEDIMTDTDKLEILVELTHESPEIASGFLTKARMSPETANKVIKMVNDKLRNEYVGSKTTTKFLAPGGEREGGMTFTVGDGTTVKPPSDASAATRPDENPESGARTLDIDADDNPVLK